MRRLVLVVEYDGTRYHGFQLQINASTIQGEIEDALYKLTAEQIRIGGASRTDTGVHAVGQVVTFLTEAVFSSQTWVKALNYYLPYDIAVRRACEVDGDFNARLCAISREYRYSILNRVARSPLRRRFVHLVSRSLDVVAMNRACQILVGEHDFIPFIAPGDVGKRCTVSFIERVKVSKEGDLVTFDVAGSSFLPHQLRNAAGGLIKVGLGKLTVDDYCEMAVKRQPGVIGPMAPACGLCLMKVKYPASWGSIGEG
ncbi:MAG: tRNA pseudouridine(38-40) synthase TruA [Dehalococcoidia bacterium]|nr:tRNA pseudouridine(38-40) synthase TruA [Dehalococcoidia bacterium]